MIPGQIVLEELPTLVGNHPGRLASMRMSNAAVVVGAKAIFGQSNPHKAGTMDYAALEPIDTRNDVSEFHFFIHSLSAIRRPRVTVESNPNPIPTQSPTKSLRMRLLKERWKTKGKFKDKAVPGKHLLSAMREILAKRYLWRAAE